MKALILALVLLFSSDSLASLRFINSSGVPQGDFWKFKCGSGLTCSRSGGEFNIAASSSGPSDPLEFSNDESLDNLVDDVLNYKSNDEHATFQITGFEGKSAILNLYSDQGDDNADKFSISVSAANSFQVQNNGTPFISCTSAGACVYAGVSIFQTTFQAQGNATFTANVSGDGGDTLYGFKQRQTAATATTLTVAQCGETLINSGAVQMELPEASTALGCRYTFIVGNASNFDVNPDDADQILVQADAVGDAMRSATLGTSITIEAISASQWAPVSVVGTWSDIN